MCAAPTGLNPLLVCRNTRYCLGLDSAASRYDCRENRGPPSREWILTRSPYRSDPSAHPFIETVNLVHRTATRDPRRTSGHAAPGAPTSTRLPSGLHGGIWLPVACRCGRGTVRTQSAGRRGGRPRRPPVLPVPGPAAVCRRAGRGRDQRDAGRSGDPEAVAEWPQACTHAGSVAGGTPRQAARRARRAVHTAHTLDCPRFSGPTRRRSATGSLWGASLIAGCGTVAAPGSRRAQRPVCGHK